ncbi:MAG: hypothetical protein J5877_03480 [Clostridia bacterium]|nr:hypothetical protein [Clostridia bacterium]
MIRVNDLKLPLEHNSPDIKKAAAKALKISEKRITDWSIYKMSVDSRKKPDIYISYSVDLTVEGDEEQILLKIPSNKASSVTVYAYEMPENKRRSEFRPVVVGFGPSGMFSSLLLAKAGLKPIVLERGQDFDSRKKSVDEFWKNRVLNTESNVQFGEGGAGSFSDGKLNTGIKDARCRQVYLDLAENGAPKEILVSAKPHIGTDKLGTVVKNIRKKVIELGGEVIFNAKLTDLIIANGFVQGVSYEKNGEKIDLETDAVILCIGHSARDTVEMLYKKGVKMIQKPFSVGARIEHPQELINKAQYGCAYKNPKLPTADYKMACHPPHGRGAYTFCMCPGGTVVCASSEEGGVVTNGMSEYLRDGENANSAVLVGIEPENFPSEHVLSGMYLQREIEQTAFRLGGESYSAPAQLVGDFLKNMPSSRLGTVKPTIPTGVVMGDIRKVLPEKVTDTMAAAIVKMDGMLKGFALDDAVLTAPETRSSSPVRIVRDEFFQTNIRGLFPCGEGAGYAGGIVSAGVDGMRAAEAVLKDEKLFY